MNTPLPIIPSLDATLAFAFQLSFMIPLIAFGAVAVRRMPKAKATAVALVVMFVCTELVFIRLVHVIPGYDRLDWNWGGKIASTIGTLIAIPLVGLTFRETGFRRSEEGSITPAVIAGILLCLVDFGYYFFFGDRGTTPPTTETLLYEATIPGLNEEPFFRALMPLLIDRALPGRSWRILGADFSVGMIIMTIWFGLGHGVGLVDGHLDAHPVAVLTTGFVGFVLAWIYLRTRSLLLPIVFHNLSNVALECLAYAHMWLG